MNNETNKSGINRRSMLKNLGVGSAAVMAGGFTDALAAKTAESAELQRRATAGLPPLKITNCKAIGVKSGPNGGGSNLIVVKVETSEPGLYGLGCATFTQRAEAVVTAINKYMPDFAIGRDADNIEDMWQSFYVSSYWRNGPVLNNALSGLDQALWDIKGKRANMPVYQLLGGKCRFALNTYTSVSGATPEETADRVLAQMEAGQRHVKIGVSGHSNYDPDFKKAGFGMPSDNFRDEQASIKALIKLFDVVRKRCGEDIELIHDVHSQLLPRDAIYLCRNLEQYRPFFIEDPISIEHVPWWKELRQSTIIPLAMGELWNNINEFLPLIVNHYFDYIRIHVSQMGGITPCMKVARLGEWFNVRTAWHGPGDVSPIGHAAHAHMDLACWNFGIQEGGNFSDYLREVFPGCYTKENGYIIVGDKPGYGIDINETLAARNPINSIVTNQRVLRRRDGGTIRP